MPKYIDKDEVLRQLKDAKNEPCMEYNTVLGIIFAEGIVNHMKDCEDTIIHAHWEWFYDQNPDIDYKEPFECEDESCWRCSHCKTKLKTIMGGSWDEINEVPDWNYCPNCGSVMDEKYGKA